MNSQKVLAPEVRDMLKTLERVVLQECPAADFVSATLAAENELSLVIGTTKPKLAAELLPNLVQLKQLSGLNVDVKILRGSLRS